jgi:glycosyltransferase involved in cell wall biosynthesis
VKRVAARAVPRVVIDARMLGEIPHGIARYVASIAAGISEVAAARPGGLGYEPIFLVSPRPPVPKELEGFRTAPVRSPFLSSAELLELPLVLKKIAASLYHSPSFSSLLVSPCPWVVTIHDLNHLAYGNLGQRAYYQVLLRSFARRARAVCAVSEFGRSELAAWLGKPASGIELVPNAVVLEGRGVGSEVELSSRALKKDSYFICLSSPKEHKNVPFLLGAYGRYRAALELGEEAWPLVLNVPGHEGQPGVVSVGPIPDSVAQPLILGAGAAVFPSLYEGFGLFPVEAAIQRVPVIASRIPPHIEGLEGLSEGERLWFNPRDEADCAEALLKAYRGAIRRPSEAAAATLQARYSRGQLGVNMDRIYRNVLDQA